MSRKLIKNMIKCNTCGDVLESTYRWEFKWCTCGRVFIDGGLDYARRGYTDSPDDYTEMSEWEDDEGEED